VEPRVLLRWGLLGASLIFTVSCGAVHPTTPLRAASATGTAVDPWIKGTQGAEQTPSPISASTVLPATEPACQSSSLRAHTGFSGAGLSHYAVQLVFTDHGKEPCLLRGLPKSVQLLDASGDLVTEYPVVLADGGYVTTYANAGVELTPGVPDGGAQDRAVPGQAFLQLQELDVLCGRTVVTTVAVTLSDGGVFRFDTGFGPDPYVDCVSARQDPPMMSSFQSP
jgi:hypothetical protein